MDHEVASRIGVRQGNGMRNKILDRIDHGDARMMCVVG